MNASPALSPIQPAIDALRANAGRELQHLGDLVAIPGISAPSFPAQEVRRSAEAVAELLHEAKLSGVRLLETGGHPAVHGEMLVSPALPTILVYGHHDVQPAGREELWVSPPFEAHVREGRVFGRGTADDKGGFLAYLAAIGACSDTGTLPCNVKVLIEGEEEIGSPNLGALLAEHRSLFASDFVVLCDTPNFETGTPALTYRLRGNCIVDVEVRCLERPVHSGQAGGLAPDAIMILCNILARLERDDGTLAIPGLDERVQVDESQLAAMRALPFDRERFRRDFGVLRATSLEATDANGLEALSSSSPPWESLWARPSLTITAIEAIPIARAANQIADVARARLSLRTVRDLETNEAGHLLANALERNPPRGALIRATVMGGPSWWEADPRHPVFAAARRALARGYGKEPVMAGSGGSIGFVRPFADLAGETPPLLTGVQDQRSNAHSENESLRLGDWEKAMISAVCLFDELAAFHSGRLPGGSL